jgi:hypothetical protein
MTQTQTQTQTIASLLEALGNVRKLWTVLAVGAPPEDKQLASWMSQFTEDELIYAFRRVGFVGAKKFNESDATAAYRYATSVLIAERRKAQSAEKPPVSAQAGAAL